jgi:hypothetical protein
MMSSTEHLIWIEDDRRCAQPLDTPNGGSAGVLPDQPQSLTVMFSIDVARG